MITKNFALSVLSLGLATTLFAANSRVSGGIEGFGPMKNDDVLDGAIVLPTLRPAALLAFQFDNLLGPSEEMNAGPLSVKVPGNFYFPRQKENYGFFPITLVKENFALFLENEQDEELQALAFQAPFSKLVDVAKNKKPFTNLLPFFKLKSAAFESNRIWAGQNAIKMKLSRTLTPALPYNWARKAGTSESADMAILFQSTPAGRWAIADINGRPANTGSLTKIEGLGTEFKAFFLRTFTRANEQTPYSIVGQIRASKNMEALEAGDLPEPIAQAQIQGDDRVSWAPIERQGWINVVRTSGTKSGPSPFLDLSFGLSSLPQNFVASEWSDPALGSLKLNRPLNAGENILLVFVGSSRIVNAPSIEDENPALFTYAEEIRMATLKK